MDGVFTKRFSPDLQTACERALKAFGVRYQETKFRFENEKSMQNDTPAIN